LKLADLGCQGFLALDAEGALYVRYVEDHHLPLEVAEGEVLAVLGCAGKVRSPDRLLIRSQGGI